LEKISRKKLLETCSQLNDTPLLMLPEYRITRNYSNFRPINVLVRRMFPSSPW